MDDAEDVGSELLVVVAHSLLGPVVACDLAAKTLLARADDLTDALRDELLRSIAARARFTCDLLADLVRSGSEMLLDALEQLDQSRT